LVYDPSIPAQFREQKLESHEAEVDHTGEVPPEFGERIRLQVLEIRYYASNLQKGIGAVNSDAFIIKYLIAECFGSRSVSVSKSGAYPDRSRGFIAGCHLVTRIYLVPSFCVPLTDFVGDGDSSFSEQILANSEAYAETAVLSYCMASGPCGK